MLQPLAINHLINPFILSLLHFSQLLYGWQRYTKHFKYFPIIHNPANSLPLSLVILITSYLFNAPIIPYITSLFVALFSFFIITYLVFLSTNVSNPHFSHFGHTTISTSQFPNTSRLLISSDLSSINGTPTNAVFLCCHFFLYPKLLCLNILSQLGLYLRIKLYIVLVLTISIHSFLILPIISSIPWESASTINLFSKLFNILGFFSNFVCFWLASTLLCFVFFSAFSGS